MPEEITLNIIDPGEALVATTGIRSVVSKAVEPIGADQRRLSRSLHTSLAKLAKSLILGQLGAPRAVPPYSYDALLDALTTGLDETQLQAQVDSIRSGDLGLAYATVAHNVVQYLQAILPKSVYQTQASAQNLQISDPEWWSFQEKFELLDCPETVFNLMSDGSLLPSQVHCLRTCYPTLSVAIDEAIQDAIVDELAKKKSFELPVYVEFGVGTWRGDPPNPAPYQNAYAQQSATTNASPSPSQAKSPLAAEASTSTEQALYKSAGLKP